MLNVKSLERYDACYATTDSEGWMFSVEEIKQWAEDTLKYCCSPKEPDFIEQANLLECAFDELIEHCKNE